jgi:ribonuclease P protein component
VKRLFRLRQTTDIQRVRNHGQTQRNQYIVLLYLPQPDIEGDTATTDFARVGVIAGKRLGNAVTRNKVKRQLKAIMQAVHTDLPKRMDVLLIARKPIIEASFQQMETAVQSLLKRADLLDGDYVQSSTPASK